MSMRPNTSSSGPTDDRSANATIADAIKTARLSFEGFPEHWQIASRAIERLAADERVLGLYLSGSFAKGKPDRWSDIDIYVIVPDGAADEVIASHAALIPEVGEIATAFPATHLGDPHQIIVFYRVSEPLHIDYQYREVGSLEPRRQDSKVMILLDRTGQLERWHQACRQESETASHTSEQLQDLETRFWAWCWYAHTKIRRGELWEAREALEFIRSNVLLPLAHREDQLFEGNRRVEQKLNQDLQDRLASTIPTSHSASAYSQALGRIIGAYLELFGAMPASARDKVTPVDRDYFIAAIQG